jgi:parvulin-like peptidyl-prolyl isomerase
VGAKSGQKKKPPAGKTGRAAGFKRLTLIVFGAIFVLLVIGFAIAQGIGEPSVPSGDVAVVKSVPDDVSNISEADLKLAVLQQVAAQQLKKAPKPGSKKAEELKEAAQGELLEAVWIQGQSEELGISVTDKQVATELAQIKKSQWPTAAAYEEFLETSKLTQDEINAKVKLQLLATKIQELISGGTPPPTSAEIAENYETNKATQFTTKPSRDVRLVINKDKGEVEAALVKLEADDSATNWKVVAKKYSSDPSTAAKGGLQAGLTEELLQSAGPLKTAIFGAATGEVLGPVKFQENYVVFEVEKLNPEKVQTLPEVKAQIAAQLEEEAKKAFFEEFVTKFRGKWTSRTTCAAAFQIAQCGNYSSAKRIEKEREPYKACYEANPKVAAKECPAPVTQSKPAMPGSVTVLKPSGEQLPQRPRPEGLKESAEEAASALPEGVPPATGE